MKKLLCLLCLFSLCILPCRAEGTNFSLNSPSAVLMDAATKRVLFEKNGSEQRYPASLTKVMTMLLAIENGHLEDMITLSDYATLSIEAGSSHIALQGGEQIRLEDAILAASIVSANDAANGIAEAIGQDQENFVQMMNERAETIGCQATHFANPHGLPDETHYSTAIDMAKIMSEACQNPTYLELTSIQEMVIEPTNQTTEPRYLFGQNRCMDPDDRFYIPEVRSAKAGYTIASKNSYLAYAKKGEAQFVVCLLGADSGEDYYEDLMTLLDYAFANYQTLEGLQNLLPATSIPHRFWELGGKTVLESPFTLPVYTDDEKDHYRMTVHFDDQAASKKKGEAVGEVHLNYLNDCLEKRTLLLVTPVQSIFSIIVKIILYIIAALLGLALCALLCLILAKKIYTKYRRYQRKKKRRK